MATLYTPDWMKVNEAAARLAVDRKTIRNRLASGALPIRTVRFGRVLRLNRRDFDAFTGEKSTAITAESA
jgi:excisionase family DNA binding protein